MNRRELMYGLGVLSVGTALRGRDSALTAFGDGQQSASPQSSTASLPSMVAGIRIVDTKVAKAATELSRTVSPPYLFNHAMRTYLFGAIAGRAGGQKFDDEVLYVACILHDLGLTDRFAGPRPFEIQGAEAAKHFLEEQGYAREKIGLVWDGIAMHASAIGQFKQPEIALVGDGAGSDVVAPDTSQIKQSEIEEVLKAFPRLKFKDAFVKTCADVVRKYPRGANGFMRDVRERYVPEFKPRNFCDVIAQAPFPE